MKKYKVKSRKYEQVVTDSGKNYELVIPSYKDEELGPVLFSIPNPNPSKSKDMLPVFVTGRNLAQYPKKARSLKINPSSQYVELGTGFGGFLPYVVSKLKLDSPRPIAIDLFDYELGEDMLLFAGNFLKMRQYQLDAIDTFLQRKNVLTDPDKVWLINTRLSEAMAKYRRLAGIADVVVDCHGPYIYSDTEMLSREKTKSPRSRQKAENRVISLEQRLLKPKGRIIRS